MYALSDYQFHLPKKCIAQKALSPAHAAKMMIIDRSSGNVEAESSFWDLPKYLEKDRVLFFNNSKVLRARIPLKNITLIREDGEEKILKEGEIFFLKECGHLTFEALVRPGKKMKIGTRFSLGKYHFSIKALSETGRILTLDGGSIFECLQEYGILPLPPYISWSKEKEADYQTSFAQKLGSVAAPTASLHFSKTLLEKITNPSHMITLHVGLGTFQTIQTQDIRAYAIHAETVEIPLMLFEIIATLKKEGKKILAIGTTVCRTLESLPAVWEHLGDTYKTGFLPDTQRYWNTLAEKNTSHAKEWIRGLSLQKNSTSSQEDGTSARLLFETKIYITPDFSFQVVDELITNFHLPESSLLVLVSAFLDTPSLLEIYDYAIRHAYRFFSFGDGMYIRTTNCS